MSPWLTVAIAWASCDTSLKPILGSPPKRRIEILYAIKKGYHTQLIMASSNDQIPGKVDNFLDRLES